jgi:transcription termination factor Rho
LSTDSSDSNSKPELTVTPKKRTRKVVEPDKPETAAMPSDNRTIETKEFAAPKPVEAKQESLQGVVTVSAAVSAAVSKSELAATTPAAVTTEAMTPAASTSTEASSGQSNSGSITQGQNSPNAAPPRHQHTNKNHGDRRPDQNQGRNHHRHGNSNNNNYNNNQRRDFRDRNGNQGQGSPGNSMGSGESQPIEKFDLNDVNLTDEEKSWLSSKDLKSKNIGQMAELAVKLKIENAAGLRRQDLVFEILKRAAQIVDIHGSGVIEILQEGYGFLRSPDYNYLPGPDDIYVSHALIRKWGLRTGDTITGTVRVPSGNERYFALLKVDTLNHEPPDVAKDKILFDNLTPIYPNRRIKLEHNPSEYTTRVVDLMAPLGTGQRALIVAPPRTGKTVLLQNIANAISTNHPEVN